MADSYLERVAGEIADLAIADEKASGDIRIVDEIAKVLGSSSQTLEEAFLTAVRVRKAEARARALLAERQANGYADAPAPEPAPLQGKIEAEEDSEAEPIIIAEPQDAPQEAAIQEQPAEPTQAEADAAKEDALERLKKAGIGMPRRVQR